MQQKQYEYTHHLPYGVRNNLCNLLDVDESWRNLGAKHGLDATQLSLLGQAYMRNRNGSPTNELLNRLDSLNVRIHDLCRSLTELKHWSAVELLEPFDQQDQRSTTITNNKQLTKQEATLVTPTPSFEGVKAFQTPAVDGDFYMHSLNSASDNTRSTWVLRDDDDENNDDIKTPSIGQDKKRVNNLQQFGHHQQQQQQHQQDQSLKQQQTNNGPTKVVCHKELERQQLQAEQQQQQQLYFNSSPKDNPIEDKIRKACSTNRQRTSLTDCDVVNQLRLIMQINYKELKVASDNFSELNIIGNGGFASVYRGNLKGTEVAIKRLKCNLVDQALNELTIMNSYRIDNILPIYGISVDGPEACLVYQYMSNGSLEDRLMCKNNSPPLTWKQRALIGEGIAKSLYYLHTLRDKPLVHGDVKSANVLLDSQFVPKLGDFGLARQVFKGISGKEMLTHCTVSSINGTSVYLPAEYLRHRILSPAVDVYSYGIVLLEMGTGKRAYDGKRLLIDRVEDETSSISSGQIDLTLKDHRLADNTQAGLKIWFELMIKLGLECAHRIKKKRPDMGQVLSKYSTFWKENGPVMNNSSSPTTSIPSPAATLTPTSQSISPSPQVITTICPQNLNNGQSLQATRNGHDDANILPQQKMNQNNLVTNEMHQHQITNQQQFIQRKDAIVPNFDNYLAQPQQRQTLYNNNAQQQEMVINQQNQGQIFTRQQTPIINTINQNNQAIGVIEQNFVPNQQQPHIIFTNQQQYNQQQYQPVHHNEIPMRPYAHMQPIDENYAFVQQQQPQQPYQPFNSSIMMVEETDQLVNNGMQQKNLDAVHNQQVDKNVQMGQDQQQASNQVEAMIPLLTELGIEGDQNDL